MILMQLPLNLGSVDVVSMTDTLVIWTLVFVFVIVFGLILYFLYDLMRYNVKVELLRQVGEPFEVEQDDHVTKKINIYSEEKSGRLYQKKIKGGGIKEYFKIKGTDWDYQNYFDDTAFYFRKKGILDFRNKGIRLFVDPYKGLIPIYMSNPGLKTQPVTLNEVIGAISDSLHERDALYEGDFWDKYGSIITIASLIGFFVIGMLFIIKYQDVFWKNSMQSLSATINAIKEVSAPALQ